MPRVALKDDALILGHSIWQELLHYEESGLWWEEHRLRNQADLSFNPILPSTRCGTRTILNSLG